MNRIRPTMNKGAAGTEKYNDVLIPSASSAGYGEVEEIAIVLNERASSFTVMATQSADNAKRTIPALNCHGLEAGCSC